MNKKLISKSILICIWVFCSFSIFAQTSQISKNSDNLHSFQLENGFQVYVLEDVENPVLSVSFVSKAGFSVQTQENAGFPELASTLFLKNSNISEKEKEGIENLNSVLKSETAIFQGEVSVGNLENLIALFAKAAKYPTFSDEIIETEFSALKKRIQENINNELAYINANIDSIIFSSPWKQDTVLYSGINKNLSVPEIRSNLQSIFQQFYTPEKSCIFVTGAIDADSVFILAKKYFNSWEKSIFNTIEDEIALKNQNSKKYVLISDNFSTDYNQLIIQYPKAGLFSDIKTCGNLQLSSLCLENSLEFKNSVSNEISGIYDGSYIFSSFSETGSASRIIIQALMENKKYSPTEQVKNILQNIDGGKVISNEVFSLEKEKFLRQEISTRLDTKTLYNALVSTWGYGGTDYFYSYMENVKQLTLDEIQNIFQIEPYVFLLLNTKTYNNYKTSLKEEEYVLLEKSVSFDSNLVEIKAEIENQISSSFYQQNIKTFKTYNLSNDIPIIEKQSSKQESFTLQMIIKGGEVLHKEDPKLETITIKYFANNIKKYFSEFLLSSDFTINSETGFYNSSITITCSKNDIDKLFSAIEKALFATELTASQADELIFNENYNYRLESGSATFQLFNYGMETIFAGTDLENLFKTQDNLLSNITFTEIYKSYTELLASNRFALICIGKLPENLSSIIEQSFGKLKKINKFDIQSKIEPIISNLTRTVQIKRLFTTDIKAEDAGPRPLKLIPTTVFTDPVDFYFETPEKQSEEYLGFLALLTEFEKVLKQNWESDVKVEIYDFNSSVDIVKVQFTNVETKNKSKIRNIFENSLNQFLLSFSENGESNLEKIINQFIMKYYKFENTNLETATLIAKGYLQFNDFLKYLKDYDFVQNANFEVFSKAIKYFDNLSVLEIRPTQ